jgi:hypothetical protein
MNNMKNTFGALLAISLLASCKKTVVQAPASAPAAGHPQMRYTNLSGAVVRYHQSRMLDIDGDGSHDFLFTVQLVGDGILHIDKLQFLAVSGIARNLLLNEQDESPVLQLSDSIGDTHPGFNWWEIAQTLLAEKRTGEAGT